MSKIRVTIKMYKLRNRYLRRDHQTMEEISNDGVIWHERARQHWRNICIPLTPFSKWPISKDDE